jgi:membrane protease YdiL (CAAX protease family)
MEYKVVTYKYAVNLAGFVFLFIPCFIYWLIANRKNQPVYGFHAKGVDLKPYFFLLLLMVPLLLWAAQQQDFQQVYPRAEHLNLTDSTKGHSLLTALYELCYSLDFVVTEFFFRGFLILALARYAGPKTILPMCVYYVSIHFDKPLGECISSFFGGALLGILVYNTRSIYGGIIVHLGIALLMEALGFVF